MRTEYVVVNHMSDDPRTEIHIVREYGLSMRVITECGRALFHPKFVELSETRLCEKCEEKENESQL